MNYSKLLNYKIATYYLPNSYYDFTSLVALFKHINKFPVTAGSNVPLWPVLSQFNILLTQLTISWLLGPDGLSKLITPYYKY